MYRSVSAWRCDKHSADIASATAPGIAAAGSPAPRSTGALASRRRSSSWRYERRQWSISRRLATVISQPAVTVLPASSDVDAAMNVSAARSCARSRSEQVLHRYLTTSSWCSVHSFSTVVAAIAAFMGTYPRL